ncbi:MAG: T9SS type A sorting domain-containing protein [Bacteroidetes bacterium]|nr:T9SS type A sorting domain-containing protein [Bacteroidota bacterium]
MKKFLLISLTHFFALASIAQTQTHICGSADYLNELDAKHPGLKARVESITDHSGYRTRSGTVTIPVVFHVVYNTSTENLANSYLNAQIDLLNQCFAHENSDTGNLRAVFKSRAGSSKIRFMIDQVIRYQTTNTSFDATTGSGFDNSNMVKQSGSGGSDAVSPDKKLNIWICDLTKDGSDVLIGYAYPPAGAPNWSAGSEAPSPAFDGVVIDYLDIGGPAKQPIGYGSWGFRGKSLVHEIGHYLGLRHIWGDDGGACNGEPGYKDDGITDTPVADDKSNSNCDKVKNTCIEITGDLPDMVENYMDYSAATCQNTFTKLQVGAMEYVIDNIRTGVRVPVGITETNEVAKDISIYPNPTSDIIYIDAERVEYANLKIIISNTIGQIKYQTEVSSSISPIELSTNGFTKGIYFVSLQFDNQAAITKKIVVQ